MARALGPHLTAVLEQSKNLIAFLAGQSVRARLGNWEDVLTAVVPADARQEIAGSTGPAPPERLAGAIEAVRAEDDEIVARLRDLWSATPAAPPALRITFPVVWQADDGTPLVFHGLIFAWSAYDRRWAMDWHPADATTWRWFSQQD